MSQIRHETPDLAKGAAKAMLDFYEVVTHDLLSHDLRYFCKVYLLTLIIYPGENNHGFTYICIREQLDTWNILARARNEGRLFSRIQWPRDPEIVSPSRRNKKGIHSKC